MKIFVLLIVLSFPFISLAQWKQMTNTPNTGYTTNGVAQAGSHRYLFTDHGVYTLNDQFIATQEIFPKPVATFQTREDTLIVFSDYVYFLIHEGDSIRTEKSRYPIWNPEISIDVDSVIIFGGHSGARVLRTLDGMFDSYVDGLPNTGDGFRVRGYALSYDTLYASQRDAIYYCKLGEYQWKPLPLDLPFDQPGATIGQFMISGQNMIVAINTSYKSPVTSKYDCRLYLSNNRGQHFTPWSPEFPTKSTGLLEHDSTYYWAVSGTGILKKGFADTLWQPLNTGLKSLLVNFLSVVDGKMYCGTTGQEGYWLSDSIWQPIHLLVPQFQVQDMIAGDGNLYVSTEDSIFQVTEGQSWQNITPTDAPEKTWPHLIKMPDQLIVSGFNNGGNNFFNWELFFLPDGGEWSRRATPFDAESYNYVHNKWLLNDGNRIFIHHGQGYYSDTQGLTWNTSFNEMRSAQFLGIAGHMVYACQDDYLGRFVLSPKRWEYLYNLTETIESMGYEVNHSGNRIDLIFTCQDKIFFHYKDYSPNRQHGFFRSDDLGETWHQINTGLEDALQSSLVIRSLTTKDSTILIVTSAGCLISYNLGDSWEVLTFALSSTLRVAILNDTLFYSTFTDYYGQKAGIWKYPLKKTGMSTDEYPVQGFDCSLYPNPAGQYFQIISESFSNSLNVRLYNLQGKVLMSKIVVPGEMIDLQVYQVGVYLVEISDGLYHQVKKLVVQKKPN